MQRLGDQSLGQTEQYRGPSEQEEYNQGLLRIELRIVALRHAGEVLMMEYHVPLGEVNYQVGMLGW